MAVSGLELFRRTLLETARFVYKRSFELVVVSVGWFLLSVPLITVGVATMGAYAAIISLRETGEVDGAAVRRVIRETFVPALVLGWLPGLLTGLWALNVDRFVRSGGTFSLVMSLVTLYAVLYTTLVLIGVYVELADGRELWTAFKRGNQWVRRNPVFSTLTAGASLVLFVVTALLTIAFVLLFPALCFSLQIQAYENARDDDGGLTPDD